jgi:phage-related protein
MSRDDKPIRWLGSTQEDLRGFPNKVKSVMGFALRRAQQGRKHIDAKPLKGFGGASVLEICKNYDGDTYRGIYTVRFADVVYVLHVFQKKSRHGARTPQTDIDLVKNRLREAEEDYAQRPPVAKR